MFRGPIQRQLEEALLYIKNFCLAEAVIKLHDQVEARRIFNYPYQAVEVILANAVYHRSYQVHEPITVRITPLGMEIISFTGFVRSITNADIANKTIRGRVCRSGLQLPRMAGKSNSPYKTGAAGYSLPC